MGDTEIERLISPEWRELNRQLHRQNKRFGSKVVEERIHAVARFAEQRNCETILDYGCGKGVLKRYLGDRVYNYDPAIEEWDRAPWPADLVVSIDMLEHVEPELLDGVLDHMRALTIKAAYLIIGTRPDSTKLMPDGRNPHLIIKPGQWWTPHIEARWKVLTRSITLKQVSFKCSV